MSNASLSFIVVTDSIATIALKSARNARTGENFRENMAHAVRSALAAVDGVDIDKATRAISKVEREALRAKFTAKVAAEYDSYSDKERALVASSHKSGSVGFDNDDTATLHSAMMTLKVRISEGKKLYEAFKAGHVAATAFYVGKMTVTDALSIIAEGGKTTTDATEGEEVTEGEVETPFTAEQFRAMLTSALTGANKAGFLTDALGIMAEVGAAFVAK
jgi:hypothetical protein